MSQPRSVTQGGQQQQGRGGPGILMADTAFAKVAGAPLAGLHLDGGLGTGCCGRYSLVQRIVERQLLLLSLLQGGQCRPPGVAHGLVARLGAAWETIPRPRH